MSRSYIGKGVLISFLITALSYLPILEGSLRSFTDRCGPVPNFGGANEPYCVTMIFSLLQIPGFVIAMVVRSFFAKSGADLTFDFWVMSGIFNFVFYVAICVSIGLIYRKVKSNV